LRHDIASHLGRAKDGMFALIDGKVFCNSIGVGRIIIVPPGGQFLEPDRVGAVAIHFVGAHVNKWRLRTRLARGLQHVQCADGVHIEIIEGTPGGQVVAGLRRSMHNGLRPDLPEQSQHAVAIADVHLVMLKGGKRCSEPLEVPPRIALRPEEVSPHVVVDAMNAPAQTAEVFHNFRPDQSRRACHQECFSFRRFHHCPKNLPGFLRKRRTLAPKDHIL
jgi:hypothetical protein